jgi:hypothetical protein
MLAVPRLSPGELSGHHPRWGLGEEGRDPHPVDVGERQLRAGVRAFLAPDQPGACGPASQLGEVTSLSHAPSRSTEPHPWSVDGRCPSART